MSFLLAVMLVLQERTVEQLVEQLRSESPELRDSAFQTLSRLGPKALPALRQASQSPDANFRLCAEGVIGEIARLERMRPFNPGCTRLSLKVSNERFADALAVISRSFSLELPKYDPELADRQVSVGVEQATLWETMSAFCAASGCSLDNLDLRKYRTDSENHLYLSRGREKEFPYYRLQDCEDVRILLDSSRSRLLESSPKLRKSVFRISMALPPGAWVESSELADVEVLDAQQRTIPLDNSDGLPHNLFRCKRRSGVPTRVTAGEWSITSGSEGLRQPVAIRGKIRFVIPEDVEAIAPSSTGKGELEIPGARITVKWDPLQHTLVCLASGDTGNRPMSFQVGAYKADGTWLFDVGPYRFPSNVRFSHPLEEKAADCPDKFECWRVLRTRSRIVPFSFSGVVVPDPE